jgi:stage II sporulation SpoAA-like protein
MSKENRVFLNEHDIIEIHVVGAQTVKSITKMGDEVEKLMSKLRIDDKPVLILDLLVYMGDVPPEGRKKVVELAKELHYDKAAMVGDSAVLRLGANLMLRATGRGDKIRYFEDYREATDWLLS